MNVFDAREKLIVENRKYRKSKGMENKKAVKVGKEKLKESYAMAYDEMAGSIIDGISDYRLE